MSTGAAMGDGVITLRDGRVLAYREYGPPEGTPLVYCHGFPGSRMEAGLAEDAAAGQGIRLIAVDRPGFGGSGYQPGRRIMDWPGDVLQLMERLELPRFGVLGVSGGAPYALACGAALPGSVARVGVVCGIGPTGSMAWRRRLSLQRAVLALSRRVPGAGRALCVAISVAVRRAPPLALGFLGASPPDRRVLADVGVRRALLRSMQEAFRAGSRGPAHDLMLLIRPWGFRSEDVSVPVHLWHGELDAVVPASATRRQERLLPRPSTHYYAGDGHYSIVLHHMGEILGALIPGRDAPRRAQGSPGT
ncbi:MAG: alpha/beta hydrolase [Gammaproteobacteria bacterium]|nr:alpha/beta hydrolase [Gammaproteobacteria bacterium]NIR81629.1 alpha/beta hydrolase [Gammaproteobacteria bacterium]NIR88180.1 alpha/beta hydrolase [Gammaproteobacteria bacterium]NIU02741.1 alpha/beta hydrolase [Gammaproteobacteria bacterium]NIV73340.1 alpha/beta fold hydrolase [Gammaproteobacteria bacterium]